MIEENSQETKRFGEKIMDSVTQKTPTKTVPVSFPRPVYKRFNTWCYNNSSDCWWLGIEKLLNSYDVKLNLEYEFKNLADRDEFLLVEIARLEVELSELKEKLSGETTKEKPRRGFGRKETGE